MTAESAPMLRESWTPLDLGLHAFLALSPLALGLWIFSFAPLVGGNLLVAVALAGPVVFLGAIVFGSLAARWPWTGGDYAWQTRLLDRRVGAVLALTSWWLVVAALAPVYGNVVQVEVLDPLLWHAGWDDLASWFRGRDGAFTASLMAIAVAAAFVGLGMRRAALAQRVLVVVGTAALLVVLGLLLSSSRPEFIRGFDVHATEVYGAGQITHGQTLYLGTLDARVNDFQPSETLTLVPLVLLFGLWIGWAGPLAGEIRRRRRDSVRVALIRSATAWALTGLVLLVAIAGGINWEFWNEANNLYWGTVYETTPTALLPAWPSPVVFATWLTDSTLVQVAVIAGMAAWVIGWTATLFLSATRVLLAAAADGLLPAAVGRTTGDSVPIAALALLVVPACGLAALDAYWDAYSCWTASAVLALALTTLASGVAAVAAFRRESLALAVVAGAFVLVVTLVIGVWLADPVFGTRTAGALVFLGVLYAIALAVYLGSRRLPRPSAT